MSASEGQIAAPPPLKKRSTKRGLAQSVITVNYTSENTPKHVTRVYSTCVERLFSDLDSNVQRLPLNSKNDSNMQSDTSHQESGGCVPSLPTVPPVTLVESEIEENCLVAPEVHVVTEEGPPSPPSPPSPPHLSHPARLTKRGHLTKKIKTALDTLTSVKGDLQKNTIIVSPVVVEDCPSKRQDTMTVKVRHMGDVHRFSMSTMEFFCKLQSQMADLLSVSEDQIGLYLNDTRLGPMETPQSRNLNLVDIIECLVLCPAKDDCAAADTSSADTLRVLLQCRNSRNNLSLVIKKYLPFKAMMELYAQQRGKPVETFTFKFDGDPLDPDVSPKDLDLEDGDTIDVTEIL